MNCRHGDLAVVVRDSEPRNIGIVCEVIERSEIYQTYMLADVYWFVRSLGREFIAKYAEPWSGSFHQLTSSVEADVPDVFLRPIRDQPGADEALAWESVPAAPVVKQVETAE